MNNSNPRIVIEAADRAMDAAVKARSLILEVRTSDVISDSLAEKIQVTAELALSVSQLTNSIAFQDIDPEDTLSDTSLWEAHMSAVNAASLAYQAATEAFECINSK